MGEEHEENRRLEYEETELRLGLPGGGNLKRGFSQTQTLDLKLNLNASMSSSPSLQVETKEEKSAKPPAKAQVVGWPPVRSFRKSILAVQKNNSATTETEYSGGGGGVAAFVKVGLDGAPYLRKVDLKMYNSYQQLSHSLGKMLTSFTMGNSGPQSQGVKDLILVNGSDYVSTYEDKDGDWMLVGDVPWEMFVDSCKRIRIMKSSEAIGLAPRAVEKCNNPI